MRGDARLCAFAELELTHSVGPDAGLYRLAAPGARAAGAAAPADCDVLRIEVIAAAAGRRRRRARRHAAVNGAGPRAVPLTVVTLFRGSAPLDLDAAGELVRAWSRDSRTCEPLVQQALDALNAAVRAYRLTAADPYLVDVNRLDPRAVRVGCATARQLMDGERPHAIELAPLRLPRVSREEGVRPGHAVAAALARRVAFLDGEELVLRSRLDARHGRLREAAAGLAAGVDLLASELATTSDAAELRRCAAAARELLESRDEAAARAAGDRLERIASAVSAVCDAARERAS